MKSEIAPVYIALVHYPVYNKNMEIIATSVTNLDLHDISRACCTYGIRNYFVVHPYPNQIEVVEKVITYWKSGYGSQYNPDRKEAFSHIKIKNSIEDVIEEIKAVHQLEPEIISTDARKYDNTISYSTLRDIIKKNKEKPYLIMLGTGWGLSEEIIKLSDYILDPIYGPSDYNHLSVRSAAAIIMDRILGY